ncbi:MAG: undecaprenyldiphospho-muramoylpentapeptide beta-N-acetylglucosaminyltransferase [Candidatus Omnitrophica bacterium]|nr:undecaprenyldiphospho-muramoylpentapeptide beta-N-acetylglucosaminyltransferase [Candidatus Omnitrophota bacterium]
MENGMPLEVLLVAEGSGGHLLPALQVAKALARAGVEAHVWYAPRRQTEWLTSALCEDAQAALVQMTATPAAAGQSWFGRWRQFSQLWRQVRRRFAHGKPGVVVGFGGWVSAPVILAARSRHIPCVVHEQNVVPGRANKWLARWVDSVAVSFQETRPLLSGGRAVVTGMPIREAIGRSSRAQAARRFGLEAGRPTVVVVGGSQGSHRLNALMGELAGLLTPEERAQWQVLHISGEADEALVRQAYGAQGLHACVIPFLVEMEDAYASADVVVARAGASTIAELARCGLPALLVPYPHAGAHQVANARVLGRAEAGVVVEESEASPSRLLAELRRLLSDERLRAQMGRRMRELDVPDASQRLARAILDGARPHGA